MQDYLNLITQQLGISIWMLVIFFVWSSVWKFIALWKSARNNSLAWFIILALFNTMGILEILYIFVFSKMKTNNFRKRKNKRKNYESKKKRLKKIALVTAAASVAANSH